MKTDCITLDKVKINQRSWSRLFRPFQYILDPVKYNPAKTTVTPYSTIEESGERPLWINVHLSSYIKKYIMVILLLVLAKAWQDTQFYPHWAHKPES